jgi:hypothetical protein
MRREYSLYWLVNHITKMVPNICSKQVVGIYNSKGKLIINSTKKSKSKIRYSRTKKSVKRIDPTTGKSETIAICKIKAGYPGTRSPKRLRKRIH